MTDERDPVADEIISELVASAPVAPPFPDALAMSSASRRPRRGGRAAIAAVATALLVVVVVLIVVLATDTVGHTPVDRRPAPSADHPLAGKDVPTTGFAILTDPEGGGPQNLPSTYVVTLVDDAGNEIASLGRQAVSDDAFNLSPSKLVVTDAGAGIEHQPLPAAGAGAPAGCTVTGSSVTTASSRPTIVAVCGTRNGDQLIGDEIVTLPGSTGGAGLFTTLIEDPPRPAGMAGGGHWTYAEQSPDRQWVLAQWSGECEAQNAFLIPATGGEIFAVTGEAGTAWVDAPSSGGLGWTADGKAIVRLGPAACGTSSEDPAGIYVVSPDDRSRTLRSALPAGQPHVLRWTSVDDRRTPPNVTDPAPDPGLDASSFSDIELQLAGINRLTVPSGTEYHEVEVNLEPETGTERYTVTGLVVPAAEVVRRAAMVRSGESSHPKPTDVEPPCSGRQYGPDRPGYLGLAPGFAARRAADHDLSLRTVGTNGVCNGVTADLRPDRLNLEVVDGVVVAARLG